MDLPNLSNRSVRNLASFAAIVGGSALAFLTNGIPAALGASFASLFFNVATGDAANDWEQKRRGSKYRSRNHDLARLVGSAISRVFYAELEGSKEKGCDAWLKTIARIAEDEYLKVAEANSLSSISPNNLTDLFASAASFENSNPQLLDQEYRVGGKKRTIAFGLIEHLRAEAKLPVNLTCHIRAEKALIKSLFLTIREMLKRSFEGNERAYGAFCLDLLADCLGNLNELSNGQQDIKDLLDLTDERLKMIESRLLATVTNLGGQLGGIEEIEAAVSEIKKCVGFLPNQTDSQLQTIVSQFASLKSYQKKIAIRTTERITTTIDSRYDELSSEFNELKSTVMLDRVRSTKLRRLGLGIFAAIEHYLGKSAKSNLDKKIEELSEWASDLESIDTRLSQVNRCYYLSLIHI